MYRDTYCCVHYIAAAGHPHMMHRIHSSFVPYAVCNILHSNIYMASIRPIQEQVWASSRRSCSASLRRIEAALPRPTIPPADVCVMHTLFSHHRLSHLLSKVQHSISQGYLVTITNHRSGILTGTWSEHLPVLVSCLPSEGYLISALRLRLTAVTQLRLT